MIALADIRAAAADAFASGKTHVEVEARSLLAAIDAIEVALAKAKPATKSDYPADFLAAYAGAPWRAGSSRPAAFSAWKARIKAGATPVEITAGAEKYGRYCLATGCEVKMAQTFFGPGEHFSADWTIPRAAGRKGQIHGCIANQDFSAGVGPDGSF